MSNPVPSTRTSLWPRLITSIILIPAALLAVYAGGWVLATWAAAAGIAMAREWTRMVHKETQYGWRFALHALAIAGSQTLLAFKYFESAWVCIFAAALIGNLFAQKQGERSVWVVMGILYIATPCLAFANLRMLMPFGFETVVWLLCVVWATDSAAYLAGSAFGGPKLAPLISPSKTWAGAIAGLAAGIAVSIVLAQLTGFHATPALVTVGAAISLLTQSGDLAESFLKRTFGVKDASDLIPGHGGALDRLDGMIFATCGLSVIVWALGYSPIAWAVP